MKVLVIGGTGVISTGIVKHLLARKAEVTVFNRGRRSQPPAGVNVLQGDRGDLPSFRRMFDRSAWDVVIDMICFTPEEAIEDVRIFANKCRHFIFCSTVCTYGTKTPSRVFIDESFPQEPISIYGRNKLLCEQIFLGAHRKGSLNATIVRPSCTYGPGGNLIDNLEFDPVAWDRMERGLPVLCAGDGLGLWVATHRDDVGKLFAYAALNPKTFGETYNATSGEHLTWEQYYRTVAAVLNKPADLHYLPARRILQSDPVRFSLLREITAFHGAYDSGKARRDVPEFTCEVSFAEGVSELIDDIRARGVWKSSAEDSLYEQLVATASKAD